MPTYEYKCTVCENLFEIDQHISDKPLTSCPTCQGKVRRLISGGAGISFKGSGFYINDSRKQKESPKPENCKSCTSESCSAKK
jgi:putative FmdB family regulatory protein